MEQDEKYLEIPIQKDSETLSFCDANIESFHAWFKKNHFGNWIQTSNGLYHAMHEINRLPLKLKIRFELCEAIRHYTRRALYALSKLYFSNTTFLSNEAKKTADLYLALSQQLSLGYKILIKQKEKKLLLSWEKSTEHIRSTSLQRVIAELSENLMLCYKLSLAIPKGLWFEINNLYWYAITSRLLQEKISDPFFAQDTHTTIELTFAKVAIIASACPYQLSSQQLNTLSIIAEFLSPRLILTEHFSSEYFYFIPLLKDAGPTFFQNAAKVPKGFNCRFFDLKNLINDLKIMRTVLPKIQYVHNQEIREETIDLKTINHLLLCWNVHYKNRRSDRKPCDIALEIAFSLNTINHLLLGNRTFEECVEGKSRKKTNTRPTNSGRTGTKSQFMAIDTHTSNTSTVFNKLNIVEEAPQEVSVKFFSVQAINKNEKGIGIILKEQHIQIKPGELIYFKVPQQEKFYLGVLRWIKIKEDALHGGIETISSNTLPIGIGVGRVNPRMISFDRALMSLPAKENHPSIIYALTPKYKEGLTCTISNGGQFKMIKLFKEIFIGLHFSKFEIKELAEETTPDKTWSIL